MIDIATDLKLKCLSSDNEGEFIDGGFKEYYGARCIRTERIILGISQHNGAAKRMITTIIERAKNLGLHLRLVKTFWADAN